MDISSGSVDSEQSKEHNGYDHTEEDYVAELTVKDEPMHHSSGGQEENLAMDKGKKKLLVDFDGQISKKLKKSSPISKSINVASDPAHNKSTSSKKVKIPDEVKTRAMTRAEEVLSSLGTKFPTFIKPLLKSHVSGGVWMGLPAPFCKSHLPQKKMEITLENESREQFQMKYHANKLRLNERWRTFAITQKLAEGDVVIFLLVEFNKFKVYIIKDNNLNGADGDLNLVNVDAHGQQNVAEKDSTRSCQKSLSQNISKRKRSKSPQSSNLRKNKKIDLVKSVPKTLQLANFCKNNDKGMDLEIIGSPTFSCSQVQFKNVKSFKDFTVVVDELCIDPELPDNIRAKYYTLCTDKKSFLHDRLMEGLNSKLISGIICEVVNISDSLKKCSLTTSREEFANWDNALKSFEFLGMDVGFLRTRIRKLVDEFESEGAIEARKYLEAKLGRVRAEDKMVSVGSKLIELEESCKKYDDDVKALKSRAQNYEHKLKKLIDAPW